MVFKKLVVAVVFSLTSFLLFAHEGHETGVTKSLHGGIVKKSKNIFVEVLQDESIEIYITDHDYKNLVSAKLPVSAYAEIKGKKIPLKLVTQPTKLTVSTDLTKEKHFKLNIVVKFNGKDEEVSFPLEN